MLEEKRADSHSHTVTTIHCCGDPDSNGYGGAFVPNPGDQIYSQEWYCDANGGLNLTGGYGCTYLHDLTTSAILSCTSAKGKPCWSVKALPLCSDSPQTPNCMTVGVAAEFIIENQSPQVSPISTAFTDFTPLVTMSGLAYSSKTKSYSQTISTDPTVYLLTDFTNTTTHINVSLGTRDQTYFDISPAFFLGATIWSYTGTPCSGSSCPGWLQLDNNPATVAIASGGSKLYQLHNSGKIWVSTGAGCSGGSCPGWQMLDDNTATVPVAADSSNLYQLHNSGKIWRYTGTACSGTSCPGWQMLDDNTATVAIAADSGNLYQLHNTGKIWKFTGTVCSGTFCPGWQMLDDNTATVAIAAGGSQLTSYTMTAPSGATPERSATAPPAPAGNCSTTTSRQWLSRFRIRHHELLRLHDSEPDDRYSRSDPNLFGHKRSGTVRLRFSHHQNRPDAPVISGMSAPGCSLCRRMERWSKLRWLPGGVALSGLAPGTFQVTGISNEPPSAPEISIMLMALAVM
jgi:hypothetical protein